MADQSDLDASVRTAQEPPSLGDDPYRGVNAGDIVRVRNDVTGIASEPVKVSRRMSDVAGGLILEEYVWDFRHWNAAQCEKLT